MEFRARAGAAPLKRNATEQDVCAGRAIPRPRGRGPIEAQQAAKGALEAYLIPRPRGRGPIEAASMQSAIWLRYHEFRARAGAAPLKRGPGA